jgi:hypothetical protein
MPKNTYWQPYITALGDMFLEEGWLSKEQHASFVQTGSHYFDEDGIRFLNIDLTLFAPGGETTFVTDDEIKNLDATEKEKTKFPVRSRTVDWVAAALADAKAKGLAVYLVGHQPLTTKKGKDELDIEGIHFGRLKDLLAKYSSTIKVAFFGHRNLAGLSEVLGPLGRPLIPSITVPGVSPRGKNQPCYNTVFADKDSKTIVEFEVRVLGESFFSFVFICLARSHILTFNRYAIACHQKQQWTFNLMDENRKARELARASPPVHGYLGEWKQHDNDVYSWRAISGETEFTADTLARVLVKIPASARDFFAIEVWKRAGYIGDETPENYLCKALYDTNAGMST